MVIHRKRQTGRNVANDNHRKGRRIGLGPKDCEMVKERNKDNEHQCPEQEI
jgi:hypothetical protein